MSLIHRSVRCLIFNFPWGKKGSLGGGALVDLGIGSVDNTLFLDELFTDGGLEWEEKSFNQVTFSANNHSRKSSKPHSHWNLRCLINPLREQL
jgi:hypothetical protein